MTTVKSVNSLTCTICRKKHRVWSSGITIGWTIFRELETFVRSKLKEYQYQEVKGPFMMDRVLWKKPATGTTRQRCDVHHLF